MIKLFSRKKNKEIAPALPRTSALAYRYPTDGVPGHRIYEEMLDDPLVRSAITVKKLGALAVPWRLESGGNSRNLEFISAMFEEMDGSPTGILFDALDAVPKGFAVMEKIFDTDMQGFPGTVRLRAAKPKDPSQFGFDVDEFLNIKHLVLHVSGQGATELPPDKFVFYAYNRRYSQPHGESDLKSAYRHWRIKKELILQWNAHLEKYASPAIVGKFKRGLSEPELAGTAVV